MNKNLIIRGAIFMLACFGTISLIKAQKMKQGMIKMEIIDVQTDQAEMQQMVGAMKGSTQEIYFDQEKQHMIMSMMGGMMKTQVFSEFAKKGSESYIDMMGQKIKMVISPELAAEQEKMSAEMMSENPIKYFRNEKKEILGHNCYKGSITTDNEGQPIEMVFWITEDIQLPKSYVQNFNHLKFEGAPLEFSMSMGPLKLVYQAVEISDKLSPNFFKKPEGEYKEMSMEELQKMGMGGQFGF